MPYIYFLFYEIFANEGNNLVDNPNIHTVERDNTLSHGLQPMTKRVYFKNNCFSIRFRNCILYTGHYFVV